HFSWALGRWNIFLDDFSRAVESTYEKTDVLPLEPVLATAMQKAMSGNHLEIRYADLLIAVYDLDKKFNDLMFARKIGEEDIAEVAYWQRRREEAAASRDKFWDEERLLDVKGIGKDWAGGFTVNLDNLARDITAEVRFHHASTHLTGRGAEVDLLERMLVRGAGASNVVLVGPPGAGRHSVLRAFASRVNSGQTLGSLRYMRILEIESASILSGAANLNEVVGKIQSLLGEAYSAENIILVINDIDAFLDPNPEAGRVNATEALLPYFQSRLHFIGTTTPRGYQTTIGKNPQLVRLISKLEINELSDAQTLMILQDAVPLLERQTGLRFTHSALKEIVKLTGKLIQNLPNPEKSLEILQETAVYAATNSASRIVLPEHVQKVVTLRTKVPVEKVAGEETDLLLNLEKLLQKWMVGQKEALGELANALRRARSGIRNEKRPIGSFLFLGPTGVGKTETARALARVYFGSEKNIIRFDMSEYQEIHGINRLIGDADSNQGGQLTEAVIASPFSLLLFDEIEKAHPKILDLFLQVFDEGRLTDAMGRTVSFSNTIIIATSNAGAEFIRQMVREGIDPSGQRDKLLDNLQKQGIFRPEFLNRFDAVVIYRPLTADELEQVAVLLLEDLNRRLKEKDVQVKITPDLARAISVNGYNPEFGARPLRRYIQEHIENFVAQGLLSGEIPRGSVVEVPPELIQGKNF
ncbi:ATP-dependent Clp protease ATP-binding subunit, partial [bacterium]